MVSAGSHGTLMPAIIVTAVMTGLKSTSTALTAPSARVPISLYLHQGSGSSRYRQPKLYDFRTDDVSDGAFAVVPSPFVSSIGLLACKMATVLANPLSAVAHCVCWLPL